MKKLMRILFIIGPLMLLAQSNKAEKVYTYALQLDTPQEKLWNTLIDFPNFDKWDDSVVDVRCAGALKKKGVCQAILATGELFEIAITDFVENEGYTLRYKLSSGNVYVKRTIDPSNNILTETVWYTGISKRTFEKYKGKDYKEIQEKRMLALKEYITD